MPETLRDGHRVLIRGEAGSVQATVAHVFRPGDTRRATEAPTFRNMALLLLNLEHATAVALVMTRGNVPMFLVRGTELWFDMNTKPVAVSILEGEK